MRFGLRVLRTARLVPRMPVRPVQPVRFLALNVEEKVLLPAEARVQEISLQIRENKEIRDNLDDFQRLLAERGFDPKTASAPPSLFKLMGLLAQKDVKAAIEKLKESLEKAGVKLTPEDLNAFMKMYGFDK